jgi:hypothetical protein
MRPPAIERMEYYPTDDPIISIVASYLKAPQERGRLLDPCAGEGIAASTLRQLFNCETWGVELSPDRAEKAQAMIDKVYQAPWQSCVLSDESISWLYLNPPYEFSRFADEAVQSGSSFKRLEWDFLKSTTNKRMRGGFLTYLVPLQIKIFFIYFPKQIISVSETSFGQIWLLTKRSVDSFYTLVDYGIIFICCITCSNI